ncbi:MAG TPA: NADPH-dependent glutamate synthase [Bacteroidales bacterium]|nr:NADPH-dependent glutamate synthase [Bacteroidales bacterium]
MGESNKDFFQEGRKEDWRVNLRESLKSKDRTSIERAEMPVLAPEDRNSINCEVNMGLSPEQALIEAKRCLDCLNPTCIEGCPIGINIPGFIKNIESGDFLKAASTLKETNVLPAVCGRVCPQEIQCEASCFYTKKLNKKPVAIGYLERFAADYERENGINGKIVPEIRNTGIKVGIIGSGPAGLAAAGDLAKYGYKVTIFEALHQIGGVLRYGIPEFRLPNRIVDVEIENLKKLGVTFIKNFVIGKTAEIDDLRNEGYKAFFIGSGAGLPRFMNIPGENLIGIYSSNEYLTRVNLMNAADPDYDTPIHIGRRVAVIGGGNTAMDSVRTAKRLGAEKAIILYRRSMEEMPARKEEVEHAIEEGIEFRCLENPVRYIDNGKGRVAQVIVQKMRAGEPDESGRRKAVPVEGSEYALDVDQVIVSIGVSPNPLISRQMPDLNVTRSSTLVINSETMQTSVPDIFAGGDIVRGGATVILAMGDGRKAAAGIHQYLQNQ